VHRHERISFFVFGLLLLVAFAVGTQHINPAMPSWFVLTASFIILVGFAMVSFYMAFSSGEWLTKWRRDCPSTAPRSIIFSW
jgi:ABC-type uncharacterized transport system permease subunit